MFYVKKRSQFLFAVFSPNLGPQKYGRMSTIALAPNRQWRSRIMRRGEGVGGRSCRECDQKKRIFCSTNITIATFEVISHFWERVGGGRASFAVRLDPSEKVEVPSRRSAITMMRISDASGRNARGRTEPKEGRALTASSAGSRF